MECNGKDGIKLLYTAISRAKQQCIVVGKQSFFQEILNNIKNVDDNINDKYPISVFQDKTNYNVNHILNQE